MDKLKIVVEIKLKSSISGKIMAKTMAKVINQSLQPMLSYPNVEAIETKIVKEKQ